MFLRVGKRRQTLARRRCAILSLRFRYAQPGEGRSRKWDEAGEVGELFLPGEAKAAFVLDCTGVQIGSQARSWLLQTWTGEFTAEASPPMAGGEWPV